MENSGCPVLTGYIRLEPGVQKISDTTYKDVFLLNNNNDNNNHLYGI